MATDDTGFNATATTLSRNPLGIIALFIVLVYAMASLTIALPTNQLTSGDKTIVVWFLVLFPVLVLLIFTYLVVGHTKSLYAPGDFADQKDWIALQVQKATTLAVATASAATATTRQTPADAIAAENIAKRSADVVLEASRASAKRPDRSASKLLWVDDHPANNLALRKLFASYGVEITTATDTDEALALAARERYAVIISDMARAGDPAAGHTLLKLMRERGDTTPYFIHGTSAATKKAAETVKLGGNGNTSDPAELFSQVMSVMSR